MGCRTSLRAGARRLIVARDEDGASISASESISSMMLGSNSRYVAFQMAEVAIPRNLFVDLLRLIAESRLPPVISTA